MEAVQQLLPRIPMLNNCSSSIYQHKYVTYVQYLAQEMLGPTRTLFFFGPNMAPPHPGAHTSRPLRRAFGTLVSPMAGFEVEVKAPGAAQVAICGESVDALLFESSSYDPHSNHEVTQCCTFEIWEKARKPGHTPRGCPKATTGSVTWGFVRV